MEVAAGAHADDPERIGTHERLMRAAKDLVARAKAARLQEG